MYFSFADIQYSRLQDCVLCEEFPTRSETAGGFGADYRQNQVQYLY